MRHGQVLKWNNATNEWLPADDNGGTNLATSDLTQTTGEDRTYNLNNNNLVFTGDGNVGIGNGANPPANKFHVAGAGRFEGILNSDGAADGSEPSYRFSDDADTGMFSPAQDQLGFSTSGVNALNIDAAQNATFTENVTITQNLVLNGDVIDGTGITGGAGQVRYFPP